MGGSEYERATRALLRELAPRTREVLERRYGLHGKEPETLDAIGRDFNITRERVRQIEASGFGQLRDILAKSSPPAIRSIERHLKLHGDLRAEDELLNDFASEAPRAFLLFLLDLGEPFMRARETSRRYAVWTLDTARLAEAEAFEEAVAARLRELNRELDEASFWELVAEEARRRKLELTHRARASWIGISREIMRGPLGSWGLRSWSEVLPRNVGDWAFLVLRSGGEPLHFTEIVRRINDVRAKAVLTSSRAKRAAHPQTVHNELIKDDRFVLIGRGLYALREWGYEPGTVREVIARVLKEARKPLTRDEIIAKVASVRRVQTNTILLNLQNRAAFSRTADGRYVIRRA
jgi:hypothetical protein